MKLDSLKESVQELFDSVSEGWRHLWRSAADALTRFKPGDKTELPAQTQVDDYNWLPTRSWAMLGGDLFEDERRLVVRLEVPGMEKEDLAIEVVGDHLVVSGEKRFQREEGDGRWRMVQCAYGRFRRVVPLPAEVRAEEAKASYRNGVLRVELPKRNPAQPAGTRIQVD
ncbi:MAG: Hsp20/alpha crystallin family protein [Thiobacillaceae bacterium]|nr:Hsp20/alpha crystallin family protein [Thiobacillaceae bacterium]MDW8323281.1 Hsp20/alpha crystallin family protein [Burkholderiales bacterium]